jgi:hypothetical protein
MASSGHVKGDDDRKRGELIKNSVVVQRVDSAEKCNNAGRLLVGSFTVIQDLGRGQQPTTG